MLLCVAALFSELHSMSAHGIWPTHMHNLYGRNSWQSYTMADGYRLSRGRCTTSDAMAVFSKHNAPPPPS